MDKINALFGPRLLGRLLSWEHHDKPREYRISVQTNDGSVEFYDLIKTFGLMMPAVREQDVYQDADGNIKVGDVWIGVLSETQLT